MINQLNELFLTTLHSLYPQLEFNSDPLTPASNPKFGDYQCTLPLTLSKELGQPPCDIAMKIVNHLNLDAIADLQIAGLGFINITLKSEYLASHIKALTHDPRLGVSLPDTYQKVVIDFSSPNIAKEMHVGHLRSTIIGDAIARIYEFQGHDVVRVNHVGDWGTQFGMLINHLNEVSPDSLRGVINIGDLVTLYKAAKKRFDTEPEFKKAAQEAVTKLQSGSPDYLAAWKSICDQSRIEFDAIYQTLGICIEEKGESFYNPYLPGIIDLLDAKGLLLEHEGAKCVFLDGFTNKEGNPLPMIVQKSDGGYNYATTDLAALRYRVMGEAADKIIYVTDAGQANHFQQVFQVANKADILFDGIEVKHVAFGLVKGEDGKKLQTRAGETVLLKDLLAEAIKRCDQKEIAIAAVKYADLSHNRLTDYVFSYEKMLSLQGNTAPYLLYAYVRINSILREYKETLKDEVVFQELEEINLAKELLKFSQVIKEVEDTLLSNRLTDYLYGLSKVYNKFYEACPVLKSEGVILNTRLVLCKLTADTLKLGLGLLGIPVVEKM